MKPTVIVIGSGFGGLAAAARLAAQGYSVKLFEKLDKLGGRAYVFEKNGFKFDAGPTVITAPFILDEIWEAAGRNARDYFELVPLDPFYRIFDHEGKHLDYNGNHEFILDQIAKWNPDDRDGYDRLIRASKEIFDTGMPLISEPFLNIGSMMRVAPALVRLQSFRSVYGYVSSYIKNDFLRRCFSFHPLLIGGNPFDASSLYVLIHHLEREWGVWFPRGLLLRMFFKDAVAAGIEAVGVAPAIRSAADAAALRLVMAYRRGHAFDNRLPFDLREYRHQIQVQSSRG